jgi:hypothetical protein
MMSTNLNLHWKGGGTEAVSFSKNIVDNQPADTFEDDRYIGT